MHKMSNRDFSDTCSYQYARSRNDSNSGKSNNSDGFNYNIGRGQHDNRKKRRYYEYNKSNQGSIYQDFVCPTSDSLLSRTSPLEPVEKRSSFQRLKTSSPLPCSVYSFSQNHHASKFPTENREDSYGRVSEFKGVENDSDDWPNVAFVPEVNDWPNGLFTPICDEERQNCRNKGYSKGRSISPHRNWRQYSVENSPLIDYSFSSFLGSSNPNFHSKYHNSDMEKGYRYQMEEQNHCKAEKERQIRETLEMAKRLTNTTSVTPWSERLKELLEYKAEYGDCLVPQKFVHNQQLGSWVNKQRVEYKLMQEGKRSSMTQERVEILERVGFVWSKNLSQPSWDNKFRELLEYKEIHGDCLVPTKFSSNPSLGRWVSTQRAHYKLMKEGGKTSMTEERFRRLESIGFVWRLHF